MTNYRPEASDTKNSVQIFQISSIMLSNSIDDALLDKKLGSTDGAGWYIAEQFLSTKHTDSNQFQNAFDLPDIWLESLECPLSRLLYPFFKKCKSKALI